MKVLEGWKTYLVAFALVVVAGLKQLGYIDENTYLTLVGLLNGAGFAALRAGVKKAEK